MKGPRPKTQVSIAASTSHNAVAHSAPGHRESCGSGWTAHGGWHPNGHRATSTSTSARPLASHSWSRLPLAGAGGARTGWRPRRRPFGYTQRRGGEPRRRHHCCLWTPGPRTGWRGGAGAVPPSPPALARRPRGSSSGGRGPGGAGGRASRRDRRRGARTSHRPHPARPRREPRAGRGRQRRPGGGGPRGGRPGTQHAPHGPFPRGLSPRRDRAGGVPQQDRQGHRARGWLGGRLPPGRLSGADGLGSHGPGHGVPEADRELVAQPSSAAPPGSGSQRCSTPSIPGSHCARALFPRLPARDDTPPAPPSSLPCPVAVSWWTHRGCGSSASGTSPCRK